MNTNQQQQRISRQEFIAMAPRVLGAPLTPNEVDSIKACECGKKYCSGWTFQPEFKPEDFGLLEV